MIGQQRFAANAQGPAEKDQATLGDALFVAFGFDLKVGHFCAYNTAPIQHNTN